jgi:hypothetical protein
MVFQGLPNCSNSKQKRGCLMVNLVGLVDLMAWSAWEAVF